MPSELKWVAGHEVRKKARQTQWTRHIEDTERLTDWTGFENQMHSNEN